MQHNDPIDVERCGDPAALPARHVFHCETGGEGVRGLLELVAQTISTSKPRSGPLSHNAQVVLGEVLNNIEEHSYQGMDGGKIKVSLEICDNYINAQTTDFGLPMPGLQLPMKSLPNTEVAREDLPEGGFGWFLIHTLAPNPLYKRRGNSNVLDMVILKETVD